MSSAIFFSISTSLKIVFSCNGLKQGWTINGSIFLKTLLHPLLTFFADVERNEETYCLTLPKQTLVFYMSAVQVF